VPAVSPCALSATAGALGSISPAKNSTAHTETATPNMPPMPVAEATNSTAPATLAHTLAATSTWYGS
jgi:hypothetical protein